MAFLALNLRSALKLGAEIIAATSRTCSQWTNRTHRCGELRPEHVGRVVRLAGWVQFNRMDKFVLLRDSSGVAQVIAEDSEVWKKIGNVPLESVLVIEGEVRARPAHQVNETMITGEVEVAVTNVITVSKAKQQLPFLIRDFHKAKEALQMQHRFLALRSPELQFNLRLRSSVVMKMREFLTAHDFVDVETPTLFRRTPGGAQEFVVPSRTKGCFYSLVQSPQQFKQMLMVGGLDRYFQIAKCYRDEGARPDRQPEFTQVDIEMSFTDAEKLQAMIEALVVFSWPQHLAKLARPFPRLTYSECMRRYGTDKPDVRHENEILDVTKIFRDANVDFLKKFTDSDCFFKCVVFDLGENAWSAKEVKEVEGVARAGAPDSPLLISAFSTDETCAIHSSLIKKCPSDVSEALKRALDLKPRQVGFIVAAHDDLALGVLGRVRVELAHRLLRLDPKQFEFLWVSDFPLFVVGADGIESAHHPFTAPVPEDEALLRSDPLRARGLHYDLVLNGQEVAGGSIRIHDAQMQEFVLRDILQADCSELQHLLSALGSGCPPHGGIALGLDRYVSVLTNSKSIRDVIAFPKGSDGRDPLSGAPVQISEREKKLYHLEIAKDE